MGEMVDFKDCRWCIPADVEQLAQAELDLLVGSVFKDRTDNELFILASIGYDSYSLISLHNGTRFTDGCSNEVLLKHIKDRFINVGYGRELIKV